MVPLAGKTAWQGETYRQEFILERKGLTMKRLIVLLTLCVWCLSTAIAAAAGSITGSIYPPQIQQGMKVARGEGGGGLVWDMGAKGSGPKIPKAEILLIKSDLDFEAIPTDTIKKWYSEGILPEGQPIYRTETDAKGRFTFEAVPPAVYYVLILNPQGKEAAQTLAERTNRDELWQKLPYVDEFEFFLVGTRNCLVEKVTLLDGQTVKIRPGII